MNVGEMVDRAFGNSAKIGFVDRIKTEGGLGEVTSLEITFRLHPTSLTIEAEEA